MSVLTLLAGVARATLFFDVLPDDNCTALISAATQWGAIFAAVWLYALVFAAVLKFKPLNRGFFQFSPVFSSGTLAILPFLLSTLPAILVVGGVYIGGWFTLSMVFIGYIIVPILDIIVGSDAYNPTKEQEAALKKQSLFRYLMWAYVPTQIAVTTYVAYRISSGTLSGAEIIGATLSMGTAAGFGIGCVHEMTHASRVEFTLSVISTIWTCYSHFNVEHLFGHHKRVATDEDPASSALNESVYSFMPNCLWGSLKSAWDIETRTLRKKDVSFFSLRNRIFWPYIASVLLISLHYYIFGPIAALFFVAQGLISSLTLENVNYIEVFRNL